MKADVLPGWQGTPYLSWHVMEYLNGQFFEKWICLCCPHNWPLQLLDLTCLDFHLLCEKHVAWMQSDNANQKEITQPSFWSCKIHKWLIFCIIFNSWISNILSSIIESQAHVHVIFLTGNDLRNKNLKCRDKVTWLCITHIFCVKCLQADLCEVRYFLSCVI